MDRPIIFTGEMVKAILDGRKTQTRRVMKLQPIHEALEAEALPGETAIIDGLLWRCSQYSKDQSDAIKWRRAKTPYGQVGDRLYVREDYRVCNMDMDKQQALMVHYYSDRTYCSVEMTNEEWALWMKRKKQFMKTGGRFMYKSLARIWLEITGVRVEILKEISDADIICEGFESREDFYGTIIKINRAKNPEEFLNKWMWVLDSKKYQKRD